MQMHGVYKAPKGLIRVSAQVSDGVIGEMRITGDFFLLPEDRLPSLERMFGGVRLEKAAVDRVLDDFYSTGIDTPALTKEDFSNAIMGMKPSGGSDE